MFTGTRRVAAHALRRVRNSSTSSPSRPAIVTASLNGVLTDPVQFKIPVTPVRCAILRFQQESTYTHFSNLPHSIRYPNRTRWREQRKRHGMLALLWYIFISVISVQARAICQPGIHRCVCERKIIKKVERERERK